MPEAEWRLAQSSYENLFPLHILQVQCLSHVSNSATCSLLLHWIRIDEVCVLPNLGMFISSSISVYLAFSFIFPYPWPIKGAMMWKWRLLTFKFKERAVCGEEEVFVNLCIPAQFFCKSTTVLKSNIYFYKNKIR